MLTKPNHYNDDWFEMYEEESQLTYLDNLMFWYEYDYEMITI